jgi:ribosome-binding protein aMBF1 (putative translation factor)
MEETFEDEQSVGQRDRISIDVSDIREQIEQCRDDVAWSELPLAAKIRVLIKERIAEIEAEKQKPPNE